MSITCPKCQFKGLIDTAHEAFESPANCVRCGAAFDARTIEEEVQTSTMPAFFENFPVAAAPMHDSAAHVAQHDFAAQDVEDFAAQDVLALPETQGRDCPMSAETSAPEDILQVLHDDSELTAQEAAAFANQAEEAAEKPACVMEEIEHQSSGAFEAAENLQSVGSEPSFVFGQTSVEPMAESDMPNASMRLMRISPIWLLVCGLTFISVIILSNQFAARAEQEPRVAANFTPPSNKATNQALTQPPAPAINNGQDASQMASAQTPVEVKGETKAVEEKAEAKVEEKPEPAVAPSVVPVVEKKSEPVIAAPQPASEKAGGFTIQIGSYNVIEEANERVARLQSGGFDVRVVPVELPKRGTWYRVQSGRFVSREEASRYGQELKSKGATDSFIIAEVQNGK